MKVRRTIEYEGSDTWVLGTLKHSIGTSLVLGPGGIREISRVQVDGTNTDPRLWDTDRPPLVYVAGPFGAATAELHERNVERAAAYRQPLADLGCYPVVPHCNTRNLGGPTGFLDAVDPKQQEAWYEGSIELLRRCDAILLIPGWEESRGARREEQAARSWRIPLLYSYRGHTSEGIDVSEVEAWLKGRQL